MLSVTLFSRVPWPEIRRVGPRRGLADQRRPDPVLLRQRYGVQPEFVPLPMDAAAEDVDADAVLLIGDRAMRACLPGFALRLRPGPGVARLDRAAVRLRRLGGARRASTWAPSTGALHEAKRRGLAELGPIAAREAPGLGLDAGFCRRYLTNIIRFDLGPREQAGLRHYYKLACELGLARGGGWTLNSTSGRSGASSRRLGNGTSDQSSTRPSPASG